jgi:hypothetical protein
MLGLIKSFNLKFYKEIATQKVLKSIGFLSVFVIVVSVILSVKYTADIKTFLPRAETWLQENFETIVEDLPVIEIKDGELVSPREYYSKQWNEDFAFIIEPREEKVFTLIKEYSNVIVLTETQITIKSTEKHTGRSDIKIHELKDMESLTISPIPDGVNIAILDKSYDVTPISITKLFQTISKVLYPFILIWCLVIYTLSKFAQVLFFSLISKMINRHLKKPYEYGQLFNIGIYALVPPTALAVAKEMLNVNIPFFGIIYLVVYFLYLFWAITADKERSKEDISQEPEKISQNSI